MSASDSQSLGLHSSQLQNGRVRYVASMIVRAPPDRHCERSEAIQGVLIRLWIAVLRSQWRCEEELRQSGVHAHQPGEESFMCLAKIVDRYHVVAVGAFEDQALAAGPAQRLRLDAGGVRRA